MIPQLPGSAISERSPLAIAPPQGFRPVLGRVSAVSLSRSGFARTRGSGGANGHTAAQHSGLRYEDKAQEWLCATLPDYVRSPWVRFVEHTEFGDDKRACVPDGLLLQPPNAFVFEIKIRHTTDAWFQLRRLYAPVIAALPRIDRVFLIEVCSSFDPSVLNPEPIARILDIERFCESPWHPYGVFVWTKS